MQALIKISERAIPHKRSTTTISPTFARVNKRTKKKIERTATNVRAREWSADYFVNMDEKDFDVEPLI